jgi:hypothetical protein
MNGVVPPSCIPPPTRLLGEDGRRVEASVIAPVPVSYCTPSIQGFAFREGVAQQLVVPPVIPLDTVNSLDRELIIDKHVLRVHFAWRAFREARLLI